MILGSEEMKRIEELKRNEELLYILIDRLQCDMADNDSFRDYLIKVGFEEEDIKRLEIL